MSPLKALILQAIKQGGPLSDLDLSARIGDEHTGGLAAMIVISCLELQQAGFIEACPSDLSTWQLSNKGLDLVAALDSPLPPVQIVGEPEVQP